MSEILIGTNPSNPTVVGVARTEEAPKATQLPKPSGYHLLCAVPEADKEYESGLVKADSVVKFDELLTTVLFVVDLGPDAYKDEKRFPSGAYCKKGDFVLVRPNAGTRLVIHGKEFRLLSDDNIEAVVEDPRGIKRKSY